MTMQTKDLIFIGIKGSIMALNRDTGARVWSTALKGSDFVNTVFEGGRVFAACRGEIFCLDPLSGRILWHNPLKGCGLGLATLAVEGKSASGRNEALAQKDQRDEQAAATAAALVVVSSVV